MRPRKGRCLGENPDRGRHKRSRSFSFPHFTGQKLKSPTFRPTANLQLFGFSRQLKAEKITAAKLFACVRCSIWQSRADMKTDPLPPGTAAIDISGSDDSKRKAIEKRKLALEKIEAAQTLLYQACQLACPLQGWADQWTLIGDHADATKRLWHKCNDAPMPIGHD